MRILAYFQKTFRENLREWKITALTLTFGPFFVYMMYAYFGNATVRYTLLALNRDRPVADAAEATCAGDDLLRQLQEAAYPDGKAIFKLVRIADEEEGRRQLKNRDADLLLVIPEDFSLRLRRHVERQSADVPRLVQVGDHGSIRFTMAAAFADFITYAYVSRLAGVTMPLAIDYRSLSLERGPSEFDLYVPALLVLAIIMVLFTAAASLIKEVDKGTLSRLVLSRLGAGEFLGAIAINQVLISTAALGLTYLAALHVGFRSSGSLALLLLVGVLSSLAVVAISLLVAAFMRTIFELLTVGVFPFFILMFFSECMFPLPRLTLFGLAGHSFYANDVLPTALTVKAFNKILNFRAGLGDLGFELVGIAVLTVLYFALGAWLFRRRHLRELGRR
ncbi:MAG: ABC transporter permease [Candidatus Aminicenantes bacterium]|nr:ABC transporter permease [Candidatus Aminicenantes bacterium]